MTKPKFCFFGTDEFAVAVLKRLQENSWQPEKIITAPSRPSGRGLRLTPPPVKLWAEGNNLICEQPTRLQDKKLEGEFFLVASYGRIIPPSILNQPKHGVLNLHPSLLPRWRGASPIQAAILNDDKETGVCLMLLDQELDHGPILSEKRVGMGEKNYLQLREELAKLGADLFIETMPAWLSGQIVPRPQNHQQANYASKISKSDGQINLSTDPPEQIWRKFRALTPNPGLFFFNENGQRVLIRRLHLKNGKIVLDEVQRAGRRPTSFVDYERGQRQKIKN